MSERERIDDFLAQQRLAFVGVSRDSKDFSRVLFRELVNQGYEVIPVNPKVEKIEREKCFAKVSDIQPSVEAVLIMTAPQMTEAVVEDCLAANVKYIWMHKGVGRGSVNEDAVKLCLENNIALVEGQCPFMFLPKPALYHRIHAFGKKMVGSMPS